MNERSEFRLGGKALAAALLGVTCGASPIPFNVLPLVMGPINKEYGWDFAAIAGGVTIFGIIASLLAPVFGGLADRVGVRRVALTSLFLFGLMFAPSSSCPALFPDGGSSGACWASSASARRLSPGAGPSALVQQE
jgi:MFS family permease